MESNISLNKKISMILVGLFLRLNAEETGSTEHICNCISYDEIVDVLSELGETEILNKVKEYSENQWDDNMDCDRQDELYDELYHYSYPDDNGCGERW